MNPDKAQKIGDMIWWFGFTLSLVLVFVALFGALALAGEDPKTIAPMKELLFGSMFIVGFSCFAVPIILFGDLGEWVSKKLGGTGLL